VNQHHRQVAQDVVAAILLDHAIVSTAFMTVLVAKDVKVALAVEPQEL